MTYRFAFPILVLLVAASACSSDTTTAPRPGPCSSMHTDENQCPAIQAMSPGASTAVSNSQQANNTDSPRAGSFHIEKNCDQYTGLPGGFCTITVSNLRQIPVGTRVVYASAATATAVSSDVLLDPPNPGIDAAVGHVELDRVSRTGNATFSGGTGKFQHFTASVVISYCSATSQCAVLNGRNWAWDGSYSFGNNGEGNP
jgi:hypothetical protein